MKIPDSMIEKIMLAVFTKESDQILRVDLGSTPAKEIKRLKKLAVACDSDGSTAKFSRKNGFAHWEGIARTAITSIEYRYGILILDRFERRTMFAIPFHLVDQLTELPECKIQADDMRQLLNMADKISKDWRLKADWDIPMADSENQNDPFEFDFSQGDIAYGAKADVTFGNRSAPEYDERKLVDLFLHSPELLVVFIAALDAQVRILLHSYATPITLYNFVATSPDSAEWIVEILRAVSLVDATLSSNTNMFGLSLQRQEDVDTWLNCEQLSLLSVENNTEFEKLKDILAEYAIDDVNSQTLKPIPIIRSKTTKNYPNIFNWTLPEKPNIVLEDELTMLHAAMERCITNELRDFAQKTWRAEMNSPRAEQWKPAELWRQMLSCHMSVAICPTIKICADLDVLLEEIVYK